MSDLKRPDRLDEVAILDRRRQVAQLYLTHQTQVTIARHLGVAQSTVSEDLAALKQCWREQSIADLEAVLVREACELDEMEAELVRRYTEERTPDWIVLRLKVKERRAKLLGLDAPVKAHVEGGELFKVYVGNWVDDV